MIEQIVMQCTKEQVNNFHKEIDGIQTEFEKKQEVYGSNLAKVVETINSTISKTDNRMSKKIEDVESKVVSDAIGKTKEVVATTTDRQVTAFSIIHLKDYVSKFFKALLTKNGVAFPEDVDVIQDRLIKAEDAQKLFVSHVTQSAFATN